MNDSWKCIKKELTNDRKKIEKILTILNILQVSKIVKILYLTFVNKKINIYITYYSVIFIYIKLNTNLMS